MDAGYLRVQARTAEGALPVKNAHVMLLDQAGTLLYETYTDANGDTQPLALPAPDAALTLDPSYNQPAYSTWTVVVDEDGFVTTRIHGVEIVATQTAILPVNMEPAPRGSGAYTVKDITLPPIGLLATDRNQTGAEGDTRVLRDVIIPDYITVHLGAPTNTAARNVRVRFIDYIKNVVSSEIYPTWPYNAIVANVHVIVTFALNRVYTEWYFVTNFQSIRQKNRVSQSPFHYISRKRVRSRLPKPMGDGDTCKPRVHAIANFAQLLPQ
jgi:hypothetical protein